MNTRTGKPRRIVSVMVSIAMTFSLALLPGVASAFVATDDLAAGQVNPTWIPEWAVDDGENAVDGLSAQADLPSSYDLRTEGLVTPVKFQNPWGSCWAFGGIAAAETSILSAYSSTYSATKLDLSERHLTYMALQPVSKAVDPAQEGEGLHPFDTSSNGPLNAGGSPVLITTIFSQGIGPVEESLYPYWGKDKLTNLDYLNAHVDEVVAKELNEYAEYNGMTEDEFLQDFWGKRGEGAYDKQEALKLFTEYLKSVYEDSLTYSDKDDWSIPETNADGSSNRLVSNGFVLKNGNILPTYWENAKTDEEPTSAGMNAIKQELVNGRGVSIMYGADQSDTYTNSSDEGGEMFCQYTNVANPVNHGVCIVGWDDSYAKENFKEGVRPPDDGAWIVKNSWGSTADAAKDANGNVANRHEYGIKNDKGEYTGYFYLSYYDRTIQAAESMEFTSNLGTSGAFATLQHDYMPGISTLRLPTMTDCVSSANVFDAEEDIVLKSVSTSTSETNMRVTFAVYRLKDDAKNPADGELLMCTSCNFEYGGFHRLDLDQPIGFKAGEKFSVISTTSLLEDDGTRVYSASANMGLSKATAETLVATGAKVKSYCVSKVNPGESWLFAEGKWEDWSECIASIPASIQYEIDNFSIKAYVEPGESTLVNVKAVESTCTQPGSIQYWYDTATGEYYKNAAGTTRVSRSQTVVAALGHDWGKGEVTKKATAYTEGVRTYTCKRCGETKTEVIAPTVTKGKTYTVSGSTYRVLSNTAKKRTVMLTKAKAVAADKSFTVPDTVKIKGAVYKVTGIRKYAFKGNKATKITVGANVAAIHGCDFYGARKAKVIVLGKRVSKVSARAFETNTSLRTLVLKTTKLAKTKNMRNCLKGSQVTNVKVNVGTAAKNGKYVKKYKKFFGVKKAASGKKVQVL